MPGYQPLYIRGMETGLVQNRQEFILPDDAYPTLENFYLYREKLQRKQGCRLIGRLRRELTGEALGVTNVGGGFTGNIKVILSLESTASIQPGSITISDTVNTFTDNGLGILTGVPSGTGTINYSTGAITIVGGNPSSALTINFSYFPGLPVMGLRTREDNRINNEVTIAFDTVYAYVFTGQWEEFIPGTVWTGTDSDFFWTTNYWVSAANAKLFWVTNFVDPIRYTDGITWTDFAPIVNAAGTTLVNCLCMLPFRGRLVTFNVIEQTLAVNTEYRQRIRWSAIGNPLVADAWRDDIRGKGGFLDIPTSEDIISVGFVRDNLVIYCERSTWQLRYTGRSIAPFQIEKVNSELGAESTFSAVQFDTSLVGIGDKGVVECDSYKSERIDIKIPDLVYLFQNEENGTKRVYGIRNIQRRLAYWTFPYQPTGNKFPDRVLLYNYENDSWAIFTDCFTCFGMFQFQDSLKWEDVDLPWASMGDETWDSSPALFPDIAAGNQQGYTFVIGQLGGQTANEQSLYISAIAGNDPNPTRITVINHNLVTGQIIEIINIPAGGDFADLNDGIYMVSRVSSSQLDLYIYDPSTQEFSLPQAHIAGSYIGGGEIVVRDNFSIVSKKFNFLDDGQNIQLGFIDVLLNTTSEGQITLKVYLDYNNSTPVNTLPENSEPDSFFNSVVPTVQAAGITSSKAWQRVYCATRGNFITIQWTLSNEQMTTIAQESDVQIDSQILWMRKAGRQLPNQV